MSGWIRADGAAAEIADDVDAIGWHNPQTDEVVLLTDDLYDAAPHAVYHYTDTYADMSRGVNRTLLFRCDSSDVAGRVEQYLSEEGFLDTVEVRKEELSDPQTLGEWAHINGAEYVTTEKVGNRKQSSGQVAIFDGSVRWGKGAYVALASENGPRGRDFVSVGYQANGHYTVRTEGRVGNGRKAPYEMDAPQATFTEGQAVIEDFSGNKIIVTV